MRHFLCALFSIISINTALGQDEVQGHTLGVHFALVDFETAASIRSSSLSTTLREKNFGKLKEMSPGLAVQYLNGLNKNFDLSATLVGAFLDYPRENRPLVGSDHLLLEADVSVRGKMFSNKYWVSPFIQGGVGLAKYQNYYSAFIPVGVGLQVNLFDEAYLLINSQYRVPVTELATYHFFHSIGLAGNIGRK